MNTSLVSVYKKYTLVFLFYSHIQYFTSDTRCMGFSNTFLIVAVGPTIHFNFDTDQT